MASEPRAFRIELRGDETAGVVVGEAVVDCLFSMLFALLLLLISPFVVPITFSVECRRLPGAGSMFKLPFDGLCSMLFIVDDLDGPGGVCVLVSVPFCPFVTVV